MKSLDAAARASTSGQCRYFASRGYVVVNQDCRGCFASEGEVNFLGLGQPSATLLCCVAPVHRQTCARDERGVV
jgi:hypothetical protein